MMKGKWRRKLRDGHKGGNSRSLQLKNARKPCAHEGPVHANQRNHIADRREGDEIEHLAQIRLRDA